MYGTSFIVNLTGYVLDALRATGSTLLNGLVSYWPLDEVSGTRYDAVGSNDLTDNNTVGAVCRGPEGTVASFVKANSEYLSCAAPLAMDDDFTVSIWWKLDVLNGAHNFISMEGGSADTTLFSIWGYNIFNCETFRFGNYADVSTGVPLEVGKWHHSIIWYDGTTGRGQTDGGAVFSVAASRPTGAAPNLRICSRAGYNDQFCDGQIGTPAIWNRVLSTEERASVLAAGNGLRYADLPAGLQTGLVSWWELDEVSGVRYDSHGSNDLTDNNTVGSVNSGPKGVVADLVSANSENLTKASFVMPDSYMIAGWFKSDKADNVLFLCANYYTNFNHQVSIHHNNANTVIHAVGNGADAIVYTGTYTPGAPSIVGDGLWHFIEAWFDYTEKMPHIRIDRGPIDVWTTTGPLTGTPYRGAETLSIGGGTAGYQHFDGQEARFGLWSGVNLPTLDELYNAGPGGVSYADLSTAAKVSLVSYWNLDEQSGVRYDSHGTNDLTDNNTVGSVINAGDAMDGAAASFVAANAERLSSGMDITSAAFTVALWTKFTAAAGTKVCQDGGYARSWTMDYDGSSYRFYTNGGAGGDLHSIGGSTTDYHLMIASYDPAVGTNGATYFWLNGVPSSLGEKLIAAPMPEGSGQDLEIGGRSQFGDYTNGQIDEVAIWSRVLTEDERTELYNLGRGKYYAFE